jgi:phenylpropionate dioxygenase-like ring-hydroxylating dioxygenase large terminal subunit
MTERGQAKSFRCPYHGWTYKNELETIVWLPDGHVTQLLDPSADRWREA